jgi:hypothetical protein
VGLDETTAQQQRITVRVARIPMTSVLRARAIGETRGFMKMLLAADSGGLHQFESGLITDDGEVTNDATAEFRRNYMTEFHAFIFGVYTVLPRNA